jgi:hypothetical protein
MNSDSKFALLPAEKPSGDREPGGATPGLKTWVTPKVITATMSQDTSSNGAAASDLSHGLS